MPPLSAYSLDYFETNNQGLVIFQKHSFLQITLYNLYILLHVFH